MIVWTDVETTDLNEREGHLLEVAMVATDDNLVERAVKSIVIKPWGGIEIANVVMPLVVREIHEKSGLLKDVALSSLKPELVEEVMIDWLKENFIQLEDLRKIPLAGSSIAFDRRWLQHHMPNLHKLFSYRSIDVSSLTELAQRWSPAVHNDRPRTPKGVSHRALDDIRHSIATLRYYKGRGFVGGLV